MDDDQTWQRVTKRHRYTFTFTGKLAGALGITYTHTQTVEAEDIDEARLRLYDTHDHISSLTLVKLEPVEE